MVRQQCTGQEELFQFQTSALRVYIQAFGNQTWNPEQLNYIKHLALYILLELICFIKLKYYAHVCLI